MEGMELVIVFVLLVLGRCALEHKSSPAYLIKGKFSGEIWICLLHTPTRCKLFYKGNSPVTDTVVHGEFLYASHVNGVILKCDWYEKKYCTEFHSTSTCVNSLIASDGFLYAGVDDGTVLRCRLIQPHSCLKAHTFRHPVKGLYKYDTYLYAVTPGYLTKCSKEIEEDCIQIAKKTVIAPKAVSGWKNTVIVISLHGDVWTHKTNMLTQKGNIRLKDSVFHDMTVFKGNMYVIEDEGKTSILKCKWGKPNQCSDFVRNVNRVRSISFVYRTYHIQSSYLDEGGCVWQSSPMVYDYMEEHRALLEVSVASGKLCDARGTLVDTRSADQGYSGRVAIFAMGPDGQLLLSYAHQSGLVHITSLFAGNPVAGAGEMIVEYGVIKKIVACSISYRADVKLNRQVVDELSSRGYMREIALEECAYTCDRD